VSRVTRDLRKQGGRLVASRPGKTKGKVERPIRYLRESFVYARDFVGEMT
jgi:hypothetical protein